MEPLLQERKTPGEVGEIGGVVAIEELEGDPRSHGGERWGRYCRRGRGRSKETWRRGGDVSAGELQGEGEPRRHGGDWWSHYYRRGRPKEMWRRGGVITTGEAEVHPRRHGGDWWSRYCRRVRGRTKETWRRLVESLLQESERENQGDMEEIGGVFTGAEGEVDP